MIKNVRRCAQCRTVQPRQLLVRIQHTEAGFVESLPGTYYPGRSLYLCPEIKCWQKALKNKGILRGAHRPHRTAWLHFCEQRLANHHASANLATPV